jgi:hypothetical protein
MLTNAPACRSICKDTPGVIMDELVATLVQMRAIGIREGDALLLVREAATLVHLFPEGSVGRMKTVAQAFVESGCARCAVNKAYVPRAAVAVPPGWQPLARRPE